MCTYNGSNYLREQLASIASQTRLPEELVVCDDGSTDMTPEVVSEFARTAPFPVRYYRNAQNLGSTKNFEQAMALCSGDLIALSDQDDVWMQEKLERQADMLERDPKLDGVFTDAVLIDKESKPVGEYLWARINFTDRDQRKYCSGDGLSVLLKRNVVTGATVMIRSHAQKFFVPIPEALVHDTWIAWMLTLYSRLDPMPEPLLAYRLHEHQQCGASTPPRTLRETIEQSLRTTPQQYFELAQQYEKLDPYLASLDDPNAKIFLSAIREKTTLLYGRGSLDANRLARVRFVLSNIHGYLRYFSLGSVVKDLCL
jgi:glycosyltransferase involved in cell wall biosynthesis